MPGMKENRAWYNASILSHPLCGIFTHPPGLVSKRNGYGLGRMNAFGLVRWFAPRTLEHMSGEQSLWELDLLRYLGSSLMAWLQKVSSRALVPCS